MLRDVRVQYFLSYGLIGSVWPYASVFFRQSGLSEPQVGYAWAIMNGAWMLSPVVATYVADARVDPRRLIAAALVASAAALMVLGAAPSGWPMLAAWAAFCAASLPVMPLQDGIAFALRRRDEAAGRASVPFHMVRVWGTIGFMAPGLLLFGFMRAGMSLRAAMSVGAVFGTLAAVQAIRLADPRAAPGAASPGPARGGGDGSRVPTLRAAAVLLRPGLRGFVAATVLVQLAMAAFAFYPVYVTERAGLSAEWIGMVSNLAVGIEVLFVLAAGRMERALGVRWLYALGAAGLAVRLGVLSATAWLPAVVAVQALHGLQIVALQVLPQTFLDRCADDGCRHSMQGVFTTLTGVARTVGSVLAGVVAAWSLSGLFGAAAVACAAALVIVVATFRPTTGGAVAPVRTIPSEPDANEAREPKVALSR